MNKYIRSIVLGDEAIALLIIEPFNGTSRHCGHPPDMGEHVAATAATEEIENRIGICVPLCGSF